MKNFIYNTIGINYNNTRRADKFITERFLILLHAGPDKKYIDIGCGTGNYTIAFTLAGFHFDGLDPSIVMLEEAKKNNSDILWINATIEDAQITDERYDGASAMLTMHHWNDLYNGLNGIFKIIKSKGRFVVFTSEPEQMQHYWLNYYFPELIKSSAQVMPPVKQVIDLAERAGWKFLLRENYSVHADLQDGFLYSGKNDPKRYLSDTFRSGISSFAQKTSEVEEGLIKLDADINNGKIKEVMESYKSTIGDYCFLVFEKA